MGQAHFLRLRVLLWIYGSPSALALFTYIQSSSVGKILHRCLTYFLSTSLRILCYVIFDYRDYYSTLITWLLSPPRSVSLLHKHFSFLPTALTISIIPPTGSYLTQSNLNRVLDSFTVCLASSAPISELSRPTLMGDSRRWYHDNLLSLH